eukprot:CAMPEP_0177706612 /NCGR_PEP_ID=MMETSP0484_2-20121128/9317_1 /TAXON_ID=354590 /ORGANISM="Rhodomonas lens, Strain RHODO" /LENGTH=352 /DNA_ID=CAMNT_0019218083 /DNA_START=67 /DNA_END=1125 /DNA_ORIENTATION=-
MIIQDMHSIITEDEYPIKRIDNHIDDYDIKQKVVQKHLKSGVHAYRHSASSTSASRRPTAATESRVYGRTGRHGVPHPAKVRTGGEDAYTVVSGVNGTLTAVLDGVGGWASVGVDSGLYSKALAHQIEVEFLSWDRNTSIASAASSAASSPRSNSSSSSSLDCEARPLLEILERAYAHVSARGLEGSCTVCMSMLLPTGQLHTLNLGDSGLRVVREGTIAFATTEQQHSFNYPLQLGSTSVDIPADALYHIIDVLPGDTIITASDGVWDNLWDAEFLGLVRDSVCAKKSFSAGLDELARSVVEAAHRRGADKGYYSPFAHNAKNAGMSNLRGGKLDDTTAVVLRVCKRAGIM